MKKRKKKEEDEDEPEKFRRKDEGAVAEHLKVVHGLATVEDFNRSYKFTILKSNVSNLDSVEQSWINIMGTMHPFGLNLDKPCGVSAYLMELMERQNSSKVQRFNLGG